MKLKDYELLKAFEEVNIYKASIQVPVFENFQDMEELSRRIEERLREGRFYGFLLRSHGLYAWGKSIREAYIKLEAFEFLFECELWLFLKA